MTQPSKRRRIHLLLFCPLLLRSNIACAHHATVANFTDEMVTVEGVIEQVRFQNPHASLLISQTSDDGEVGNGRWNASLS